MPDGSFSTHFRLSKKYDIIYNINSWKSGSIKADLAKFFGGLMREIIVVKKKTGSVTKRQKSDSAFRTKIGNKTKLAILGGLVFLLLSLIWFWQKSPSDLPSDSLQEGLVDFQAGNFDEASENFEQAVEADQNDPEALDKLALSQYNQKKYAEALENLDKSLALNPQNYLAYNSKANVYRDQKEFTKAEENYRKAIELNPRYDTAYSNLAIMLLDEGKRAQAKEVISEGLRMNPENENLKNIQQISGE